MTTEALKKPCEYCGQDLPLGVDKPTRQVRSYHFSHCTARPEPEPERHGSLVYPFLSTVCQLQPLWGRGGARSKQARAHAALTGSRSRTRPSR